ncbi:hypothetical protein PV08_02199 [Exophiala spinifera]|uniref:DUF7708 domain-containing protein n=1 Tax=Exophiala spinifera TaxID=91928 RepID=A0A0D2CDK8_9EURO|nr:uncharacterized protein PV08_02199 [Exophiala spinifera]KIW21619.1 hypothetical protein PV08_02199 [Exophiala spinifera]
MNDQYSRFSSWYCRDTSQLTPVDPSTTRAFTEAVQLFNQLTKDPKKAKALDEIHASSIADVVCAVEKARERYERRRSDSKARSFLVEVSRRLVYYGNVMDVMVQHHPEYVSLAWGTMKLLCGAVVENEKLGMTIVTGLCEIGDALPRTELFLELYPTDAMKNAVTSIYTWILRFLTRALKWYEEGKIRHALNAVIKPAALQYDDIMSGIRCACQLMSHRASANSLAEQRDMHEKLRAVQDSTTTTLPVIQAEQRETHLRLSAFQNHMSSALSNVEQQQRQASKDVASLTAIVTQVREMIISDQAVNADMRIQVRNTMSEMQLVQALGIVSASINFDHVANLQQSIQLRDRRRFKRDQYSMAFQKSPAFNEWNSSADSGSIKLTSTFKNRNILNGSLTLAIECLRQRPVAVLLALQCRTRAYDPTEILKSLICQALTLDQASHIDVQFSFQLRRYLDAYTEEDYFNILGEILSHFRLVYIIIQLETVRSEAASRFQLHLDDLLDRFKSRPPGTVLKTLLAGSGPLLSPPPVSGQHVLRIGGKRQSKDYRKNGVSLTPLKRRKSRNPSLED